MIILAIWKDQPDLTLYSQTTIIFQNCIRRQDCFWKFNAYNNTTACYYYLNVLASRPFIRWTFLKQRCFVAISFWNQLFLSYEIRYLQWTDQAIQQNWSTQCFLFKAISSFLEILKYTAIGSLISNYQMEAAIFLMLLALFKLLVSFLKPILKSCMICMGVRYKQLAKFCLRFFNTNRKVRNTMAVRPCKKTFWGNFRFLCKLSCLSLNLLS